MAILYSWYDSNGFNLLGTFKEWGLLKSFRKKVNIWKPTAIILLSTWQYLANQADIFYEICNKNYYAFHENILLMPHKKNQNGVGIILNFAYPKSRFCIQRVLRYVSLQTPYNEYISTCFLNKIEHLTKIKQYCDKKNKLSYIIK